MNQVQFQIETTKNTIVDYPRLEVILSQLIRTNHLPGLVAEVGVYKGGTAHLICTNTIKPVLLFDTFTGMPQVGPHDMHSTGDFDDTSLGAVQELLSGCNNAVLAQGIFPLIHGKTFENCKFSFVHLDCDIYQSVRKCLEWFYPRMVPGGVIILDDYNEPNCPGAKLAADEFVLLKNETLLPTVQSQAIIIKA